MAAPHITLASDSLEATGGSGYAPEQPNSDSSNGESSNVIAAPAVITRRPDAEAPAAADIVAAPEPGPANEPVPVSAPAPEVEAVKAALDTEEVPVP